MEARRPIHHPRNTIDVPDPGENWKAIRLKMPAKAPIKIGPRIAIDFEAKVVMTLKCIWCLVDFDDYSIRCRVCGHCQFCGYMCPDNRSCYSCGNMTDVEFAKIS